MKRIARYILSSLLIGCIVMGAFGRLQAFAEEKDKKADHSGELEKLEYDRDFFEKKKDPIFAGMLSWYVPGLGQYYSGEVGKGTFFLVTETGLTVTALFYFLNFDFSAGNGGGFRINADAKRTDLGGVETSRRNIFIGMMTAVFALHLYNISDAVSSAKEFNLRLEKKRERIRKTYPFLDMSCEDGKRFYLGYQSRF